MSVVAGVALDIDHPRRPRTRAAGGQASRHLRAVPATPATPAATSPASAGQRRGSSASPASPAAAGQRRGSSAFAASAGQRRGPAAVAEAPSPTWRLTRRGRMVVLGLLLILLTVGTVGFGAARALNASTAPVERQVQVVVAEGDTLWTIAADVAPRANREETVDRIREANRLRGNHIEPGQQIVVPVTAR